MYLQVMRNTMAAVDPGLDAPIVGLEASGRWLLASGALAELLFWPPVPRFEPSPEAMTISQQMVDLQRAALVEAVTACQLGPGAARRSSCWRPDSDEAVFLVSTLIVGVLSQAFANEPDLEWGTRRFTPLFPKLMRLLVAAYPPLP